MANPTEERQLRLMRQNIARFREHALAASDALHIAATPPESLREHLQTLIRDMDTLGDIQSINAAPAAADRFWSRILRPESDAHGLLAPCWPASYVRLKTPTGRLSIAVAHWRGRMRPVSHIAFELEFGRELDSEERLRRICPDPTCANIREHYKLERKRSARVPQPAEPLLELLGQASEEIPMCRNGHHLKPGQIPNHCARCRAERRKATHAKREAAWRATYYGEIETPGPRSTPPSPPSPIPAANGVPESPPALESDSLDDIEAAIRDMFQPTPESARILAIHERSRLPI